MVRNFQKLLSANLLSGILGLLTLTIVSRDLGPESFGIFAVIISLGAFVEQVAGFQAWQAITKYAADAEAKSDTARFWHIVSLGVVLDLVGSFFAATLGVLVTLMFSRLIGLESEVRTFAALYMFSLVFAFSGTSMAVLRIKEQYNLIGIIILLMAALKLAAIAVALNASLGLLIVLAIFAGTTILQHVTFLVLVVCLARKSGGRINLVVIRIGDVKKFPGLVRFLASVWLSTSVRQVAHELDTVMLSAAAGPLVAGQYRLAKQYGSVILRVVEPGQQVVYPRIAALVASDKLGELKQLVQKLAMFGIACGCMATLSYYLIGERIILAILGHGYELVPSFLGVFMATIGIFCGLFFIRPLVLSFGRADAILGIYTFSTIIFLLTFYLLYKHLGPIAMMYAQLAFYVSWAVGMILTARSSWNARAGIVRE